MYDFILYCISYGLSIKREEGTDVIKQAAKAILISNKMPCDSQ